MWYYFDNILLNDNNNSSWNNITTVAKYNYLICLKIIIINFVDVTLLPNCNLYYIIQLKM